MYPVVQVILHSSVLKLKPSISFINIKFVITQKVLWVGSF